MAQRVVQGAPAIRIGSRLLGPAIRAWSRRTMIPKAGSHALPGLTAPVRVDFDDHGVPHVDASTDADAFRAIGFVHALDRWFQMDLLRRVLRGRLSAVLGDRPLGAAALPPLGPDRRTSDADHLMRVLGLERAARGVWATAEDEGRSLLRAYVQGVNRGVRLLARRKPLEHRLLRMPIQPWTPIDSIVVAKGMALGLSFKWRSGVTYAAVAKALEDKPQHLAGILPEVPEAYALGMVRLVDQQVQGALAFGAFQMGAVGSNAWIVGGDRTRGGLPILASDPHLELSLPSIWYLASIRGARYGSVGCTLPGVPGVVIGRTRGVAWGVTNGMVDDADFWVEELDAGERRYKVDGDWRPLKVETQPIHRRRAAPRMIRLRRTHRGALFSDAFPGYEGPPLSLRFSFHEPAREMETFLALGRAQTAEEALASADEYVAPAQNLLVADTRGGAGYRLMGRVPLRTMHGHPALPRDGTTTKSDWLGWIPQEEMPACRVARDEVFVSANQAPVAGTYPHYISHLYEPDHRAVRIHELLASSSDHTQDDVLAQQLDATDVAHRWFRKVVLLPHAEAVRRNRPVHAPLIDRLLTWAGDENVDARGGPLFFLTYHHLARRTFARALGPELMRRWLGQMNLVDDVLRRAFSDEDSVWAPPNVRATLLTEALDDVSADLGRRGLGPDSPWGDFHRLLLKHPAGAFGPVAGIFNRGPFPVRGGPYTPSSGQFFQNKPGPMVVGASYRHVVDLADPDGGQMITFGGQSGYVGSPHYDDLTERWLANDGLPMRIDARPERATRLSLLPG